jgi:hypothetical protein
MKLLKSTGLVMAVMGVGLLSVLWSPVEALSPSESSPPKTVTGEVAQVEGEFHMAKDPRGEVTLHIVDKSYVITSQVGEEVRLELDDHTIIRKKVNPGDKIVAKISSEGHTLSVTRLDP